VALNSDGVITIPARVVQPVDTTGAGDCFVGALAAQIAAGATIRGALAYANIAASLCVQRLGAGPSMPTAAEVAIVLRPMSSGFYRQTELSSADAVKGGKRPRDNWTLSACAPRAIS
jgi:ribokinase